MTKINFEHSTGGDYTLSDLETGDFFLNKEKHLCMFIEETEDYGYKACYYDFCLQKIDYNYYYNEPVDYLPQVNISY